MSERREMRSFRRDGSGKGGEGGVGLARAVDRDEHVSMRRERETVAICETSV